MAISSPISTLIDGLVSEASQAPRLLSDLAKIEKYIAESYKTRSLIELIQNADDAGATEFVAERIEGGLVVANNGREFTIADVESLCRSGASNKLRGGTTIGYRGIGFKSVVNIAACVWVFSGDQSFVFDRNRTRAVLGSDEDVPLIRIPHLVEIDDTTGAAIASWRERYQTVFFFAALDTRLLQEEVEAFDSGCLLFLYHLERVTLCSGGQDRAFVRSSHVVKTRHFVVVSDASSETAWEVLSGDADGAPRVALKMDQDRIVPAPLEQATIHSFIPTTEYTGASVKFNGDFTTDPSRKTVDLDAVSSTEYLSSCAALCDAVRAAVEGIVERPGLFGTLTDRSTGGGRFRPMFWKTISSILTKAEMALPGGSRGSLVSVRLRPEWLNQADYEALSAGRWPHISKDVLVTNQDLGLFLDAIGARSLTLEDALACIADVHLSIRGLAELFARCVAQFRYDCDGERLRWLRRIPLFPTGAGLLAVDSIADLSDINSEFVRQVSEAVEASDLKFFLKRLGIHVPPPPVPDMVSEPSIGSARRSDRNSPAIAKWRSAERNALEYIKAMDSVLSVSDVSQANLGHDLEVTMKDGRRKMVEVKSVTSFSAPFRLTSNEYATASNAGADYVVAIVVNGDEFDVTLVSDPVSVLDFERRCEQWSWQCSDYVSSGKDPEQVFSAGRTTAN